MFLWDTLPGKEDKEGHQQALKMSGQQCHIILHIGAHIIPVLPLLIPSPNKIIKAKAQDLPVWINFCSTKRGKSPTSFIPLLSNS